MTMTNNCIRHFSYLMLVLLVIGFSGCGNRQKQELHHLKIIGIAIHEHLLEQGELPTGIKDKDGSKLLSWRVQLLPYLGHGALFDRFHMDEPWDSLHNKALVREMPEVFGFVQGKSNIVSFGGERPKTLDEITIGYSKMIFAVSVSDKHSVNWTEPAELSPTADSVLAAVANSSFLALMYDGSAQALPASVNSFKLQQMIDHQVAEKDVIPPSRPSATPDVSTTPEQEQAINKLDGLLLNEGRILHLNNPSVGDAELEPVWGLVNLQILNLSDTQISDKSLKQIVALKKLTGLAICNTNITDVGLTALTKHENLRSISFDHTQITDQGLQSICMLKRMTGLHASSTNVTDQGLKEIEQLQQLKDLQLNETAISDGGLEFIGKLRKLEYLQLGNTRLSDSGLKRLNQLGSLRRLDLTNCDITDEGVKNLVPLGSLQFLDLSGTQLTDQSMKIFASMSLLRSLDLSRTRITGSGLGQLTKNQGNLNSLILRDTDVSIDAIDEFRKACPKCTVILK